MSRRRSDMLDAFVESLYRRLGRHSVVAALAFLAAVMVLGTVISALVAARHREFGPARTALSVVDTVGLFMAMAAYLLWRNRRAFAALRRWAGGERSSPDASTVLVETRLVAGPVKTFLVLCLVGGFLGFGIDEDWHLDVEAGLLWAQGGFFLFVYYAAYFYFFVDLFMRPVRREVGAISRFEFETQRALSLTPKLLGGLALLVLVIGFFISVILAEPGADPIDLLTRNGLMAFLALAMSFAIAWPAVSGVLSPVDDLIAGTSSVARGDLSADVPVASTDELGELAVSFNEMVDGLRDREGLRSRNDELLEEVRASRARIVTASDAERRRVERNIHDGAQQQLVGLALKLRALEENVDADARALVVEAQERLKTALHELRELARGLHPSVLTTDGLAPALEQLAARVPLPVTLDVEAERYPEAVESTAYFVVSEALANVAKYAEASHARIKVERHDGRLVVAVEDDGVGGAAMSAGSGLSGLRDRVSALDGTLTVASPPGEGTTVTAELRLA